MHPLSHNAARSLSYLALGVLLLVGNCIGGAVKWKQHLPHKHQNPGTIRHGYKTAPFLRPQKFKPITKHVGKHPLYDGYIFLAMMRQQGGTWGPQIYDHDGNVIWYGNDLVESRCSDFHVCDYMGVSGKHLCFHERVPNISGKGPPQLKKVILNDKYEVVQNFSTDGNGHEFHMVDRGYRFVTMNYEKKMWDLRPFFGFKKGWINDGCILEYDSQNANKTWEWCYSDHLPLSDAKTFPSTKNQMKTSTPKAGHGSKGNPWDVAHLNSVEKDEKGNFIASLRHLDQVVKVAGPDSTTHKPNTIIWRLNGKGNQFKMDFNFSKQHDVRIFFNHPMRSKDVEVMNMFNNAWEGVHLPIANRSSGQTFALNEKEKTATLLNEYPHPGNLLAGSRGSMQVLPNGNAFLGWGVLPEVSEFSKNGTMLYHARFAPLAAKKGQYSYRAFNQKWVGNPPWPPKLVAYKHSCSKSNPTFVYASWNGATEIKKWKFSTGMSEGGPWFPAGSSPKDSFETQMHFKTEANPFVLAEALDANNNSLGSTFTKIFIPPLAIKANCNQKSCPNHFDYTANESRTDSCGKVFYPALPPFFVFLLLVEVMVWTLRKLSCAHADRGIGKVVLVSDKNFGNAGSQEALDNEKLLKQPPEPPADQIRTP